MLRTKKWLMILGVISLTECLSVVAEPLGKSGAKPVEFIACPVYRDTRNGRKSGCWLSDDPVSGVRYDVTKSPTNPDYNYKILVEGLVAADDNQDNACGGVVLEPVRVSVLLDQTCPAFIIEDEGFPGRKFKRHYRSMMPKGHAFPPFEGPVEDRTFAVLYDFNKSFLIYEFGDYLLDRARRWIFQTNPKRIIVTGYADVAPRKVTGISIAEDPEMAQERAESIVLSLVRLGVDPELIEMRTSLTPEPVDAEEVFGLLPTSLRRVDIRTEY